MKQIFSIRFNALALALVLVLASTTPALHAQSPGVTIQFAVFGDYGSGSAQQAMVAELVNQLDVDFIATTGDNAYGNVGPDNAVGQFYHSYVGNYQGAYGAGSLNNRYFPSMGNHDWTDGGRETDYFDFFTLPGPGVITTGSSETERYYDIIQGPVHLFFLDSSPMGTGNAPGDGRSPSSPQALWLSNQVAQSTSPWKLAVFHHPPYSSSNHGTREDDFIGERGLGSMKLPFAEWGVHAVLSGHDHVYERILKGPNNYPFFVTGLGGRGRYGFDLVEWGSQVRYNEDLGTMMVSATSTNITFEFWSVNTAHGTNGLIDTYTLVAGQANPGPSLPWDPPGPPDPRQPPEPPPPPLVLNHRGYWPGYERSAFQEINDLESAESMVYVVVDSGLIVIDATDPPNPNIVGGIRIGEATKAVHLAGNLAYVVNENTGLSIIDVEDPSQPSNIGSLPLEAPASDVDVTGQLAVVASGIEGLVLIDVSQSGNPSLLNQVDTIGPAAGIAVVGHLALVAAGIGGLQIIDLSNPYQPFSLGSLDLGGSALAVTVMQGHAVIANGSAGLAVVDISAPSYPVLVGNIDTGGVAVDVEVSGRFVYLVDLISGLKLFDLSDPSDPVMSGQWSTSGLARRVAKVGPWAWVTVIDFGIEMADVTNIPNSSKTIALELQPHAEARDVEVVGQVAYLADGPAGIQILDASDSLNPQRISHLDTDDEIWDLEVIDDVLYAASGTSGLEIFDVSDPHKPRSLGHLDTSGSTRGLAVVGDLAYVADGENGLIIIDVSHASNPILVGELVTSGFAWDVAVTGTMAYLSDGPSGLQIIDVTDPAHPVIQSRFGLVDIRDFEVVDHVGYAVLDHRLWLVDLTEPKNPGTLGFISFAGPVFDVDVQGGLAFVAADSRLDVIDVSNPKNPVFVTGTKANGRAMGVTVIDRAIYLASGTWGLLVGSLPPIAHAQVDFTTMESPITINLNGIDLDGTALTFSVDRPPYQGIVSGAPPHLTYSPDELYWGEDSFTFHASSGGQDSLPATVRIHISPRDPYVYDNGETFWQTGTFSLFRQTVADDFILDESATITGVSVDTFNELRGNFTWRIYEDNDGLPGQLIASGSGQDMISKLVSTLPNNSRYYNVHFNFGREVFLKKSTPYWLGLRTTSSVRWVYSKRRGHPIVFQGGSTQNWMPLLSSQFGSAFRLSGFPNHRPIALLELSPVMPKDMSPALPWVLATDSEKASVVLDGSLSTDQDGDSLTFAWYLTPSAVPFATSMEAILSVPIGEHTVSLVVDDSKERSTNSVTFQVITPCHALNQIREQIVESSIPEEQLVRPLIVLLQAACASFDRKKTVTGLQQLRTLQTLSQAKLADSFPELAENLIRAVNSVIRPILAESRLLHLQRFNHDLELIWADGQLQEADTPTGPWRDVTNAHSPFSVNPNGEASSRFYRIRTVPLEAPESSLE